MRKCLFIIYILILTIQNVFSAHVILFPNACVAGKRITIAAVGDLLLHAPLQRKGFDFGFQSLWLDAIPYIKLATFSYANLEGPMADYVTRNGTIVTKGSNQYDNNVYSSYPLFNYPSQLAKYLKQSGFTIVSTANNHALDRYSIGIDKTIEALNTNQLAYTGTIMHGNQANWITILNKDDVKIAWIACTAVMNGQNDRFHQILKCYEDQPRIIEMIKNIRNKVDAIVILPHWGEQYHTTPTAAQIHFAHAVLDAGAMLVIGSHPHVLQPMERYQTTDHRDTFIMYSLGNFVSFQGSTANRSTIILLVGLTKGANGTFINGISYVPMYMENRSGIQNIKVIQLKESTSLPYQYITHLLPEGNAINHFNVFSICK